MTRSRPPNVIVVHTDQQRHDTTGVHGCPLGLTPNFDRMAMQGTHLRYNFTCQPVCAPARACLQTGRYATQNGVWRNGGRMHPEERTLAHYFNEASYHTGYIGKWHLAPPSFAGPVPLEFRGGYQSWLAANVVELTSDAYDARLWDEAGCEHKLPGYRVDATADAAIRHIAAHRHHPFFLFVSFLEPHHQNHLDAYPAPEGSAERYAGAWMPPDLLSLGGTAPQHWPGYCGMIKRIDEAFGRMRDALTSLDLAERTVVLYTSDHGNHFKTRNDEYKRSCHEASIRTPAAFCGPGFDSGGSIGQFISTVDLTATLLAAAGISVPDGMAGRSLLPLLGDRAAPWPDDVLVQISESQTGRAARTRRWKYCARLPLGAAGTGAEYQDDCLYDLLADPWELINLIGMEPFDGVVAEMRERLTRRMVAAGEAAPAFIAACAQPAGQRRVDFISPEAERWPLAAGGCPPRTSGRGGAPV